MALFRGMLGALLVVVVAVPTVRAEHGGPPIPGVGQALLLHLEGVIEASPDAARGKGFAVTSFGFHGGDEPRWLAVTKARTQGGDQPLEGKDVLELVDPYTPNFLVTGPEKLIARLRDAPPGTPVRVEGVVRRGSRVYHLRRVEDVTG